MTRGGSRWMRFAIIGTTMLVVVTCVRSTSVECPDGRVCADGTTCVALQPVENEEPPFACASAAQFAACDGDGAACATSGGICVAGACFVPSCGDNLQLQPFEVCDDGNRLDGDGCSADCTSEEVCNDGVLNVGEQCDDGGVVGLSGDGCTAACVGEFSIWRDVDPGTPTIRVAHAATTAPGGGILIYGGGLDSNAGPATGLSGTFNDLWRWDGGSWHPIVVPEPPPRRAHAAMAYDAALDRVVIFGGYAPSRTATDDMLAWDGTELQRLAPAVRPSPRAEAGLACHQGQCILFGGSTGSGVLADSWVWNGTTWRQLAAIGVPGASQPVGRVRPVMVFDPGRDRIMLYGGASSSSTYLQDTWEIKLATPDAIWILVDTPTPPPALHTIGAYHAARGELLITVDVPGSPGNDTSWALAAEGWTRLAVGEFPSMIGPRVAAYDAARAVLAYIRPGEDEPNYELGADTAWAPRTEISPVVHDTSAAAYDPRRGEVIVSTIDTTWSWDGASWRNVGAFVAPRHAAMAFDVACDRAVRFGGVTGVMPTRETATFDPTWTPSAGGSPWSTQAIDPMKLPPAARLNHAMAYDVERGAIVVHGGRTTVSNPPTLAAPMLWTWSGACDEQRWSSILPMGVAPGPREHATMTYDAKRKVVVMFGGSDGTADLDETWEWDGVQWHKRTPDASPAPRSRHAAAYDPKRQRVVIFGGQTGEALTDDVWAWDGDGNRWLRIGPVIVPPARSGHLMAADATGGVISIGGGSPNAITRGVLRLTSEQTIQPVETCRLVDDDLDLDGLHGCDDPDCRGRCAPLCDVSIEFSMCVGVGPTCGDSACSKIEDRLLCPDDCP